MNNDNKYFPDNFDNFGPRAKGLIPQYSIFYLQSQSAPIAQMTSVMQATLPAHTQSLQYPPYPPTQFHNPHQVTTHQLPFPHQIQHPQQAGPAPPPAPLPPVSPLDEAMIPVGQQHGAAGGGQRRSTPQQRPLPTPSPPTPKEREPQFVTWVELVQLLPTERANLDQPFADRPGSGQLPDGRFFTPKTSRKDHYFIFASKADYIAHFVHYYFSATNMARDRTLQDLLVEGGAVPVEKLLLFPKLSQIETSESDLTAALRDSRKVKIDDLTSGQLGVRRRDNWSPSTSTAGSSGTPSPWPEGGHHMGNGVVGQQNQPPTPNTQQVSQPAGYFAVNLQPAPPQPSGAGSQNFAAAAALQGVGGGAAGGGAGGPQPHHMYGYYGLPAGDAGAQATPPHHQPAFAFSAHPGHPAHLPQQQWGDAAQVPLHQTFFSQPPSYGWPPHNPNQ